ncbi:MAG: hypothetical protein K6A32_08285 [Bacteroidales bacterium]|nr:hypothetical protein [Bacteroidales bacterium]
MLKRAIIAMTVCLAGAHAGGQTFTLQQQSDSSAVLVLEEGGHRDAWQLPYPTYSFTTGDVNGDGRTEALVGVIKPTRFDPRMARRLFVFQQSQHYVRPLWLGSRLAGELYDFRWEAPYLITLEQSNDSLWFVGVYQWDHFGFTMKECRIRGVGRDEGERSLISFTNSH